MSRSEQQARAVIAEAVGAGSLSPAEAAYWSTAVKDPCGCAEGLAGGVVVSGVAVGLRGRSLPSVLLAGAAGFGLGAVGGKVVGVARGLPLVRHQRAELGRRVAELSGSSAPEGERRTP
jgi:hypothetical protein